ncbi:MAG: hypothetical protein U5K32_13300 [Bacteroidales bacterium]|nr:hypothetical protein [Bacteroidales bacterium]
MKTQKIKKFATGMLFSILLVSMMSFVTSCAQKIIFLRSSVVPAAEGTVTVKQDKNNNYLIKVEIEDLAEVERLQSTRQTYVVWMESDKGNTENLGQLKSAKSIFSKQKTASLETVSSFKPVRIFVTAENGINVRFPGEPIILTTDIF